MKTENSTNGGITLTGALLLTFIILRLTGVIAWSWWWVLSPLWIWAILTFIVIVVCIIIQKYTR